MKPRTLRHGMTVALAVTSLLPSLSGAADAPGNAVRGKQLFYDHGCYGCHGYNGETGARDLVGTGSPLVSDLALFRLFLRQRGDVAPHLPVTRMPNYAASALPEKDVDDLFAYIRGFKANAPAVKDVPTLQAILESAQRQAPR